MEKTNLRFDWIGKTTIQKHYDDLTRDELLMYVDWLENKLVKNCSIPDVVESPNEAFDRGFTTGLNTGKKLVG